MFIDRAAIFFDNSDYRFFLDYLPGAADNESVGVHAYVLMTNHVHLLMTAEGAAGVPRVMKGLGPRYGNRSAPPSLSPLAPWGEGQGEGA